jgi:hypothetical protein
VGIVSRSQSGAGTLTAVPSARVSRAVSVGGDIALANNPATFVELAAASGGPGTGGLDLTVAAAASDVLLVGGGFIFNNTTAINAIFDIATWVSGAAVNWLGQSAGGANIGLAFMNTANAGIASLVAQYVVQAGDITGGNVVLRPHYRANGARTVARSVANGPLMLSVANLLH